MSEQKCFVVGVGMTKFEKPGRREGWDYPQMAKESGTKALDGRGHRLRRGRAGLRRLRLRRLDVGPARALRARHDRHPDRQRQQQLLDRIDGALPGRTVDPRRTGRLRDRARLREDAARLAGRRRRRPRAAAGQPRQGAGRDRRVRVPGGAVDVRRGRPRAHEAVRHHRRALREDRLQEPQALGQQPVRAVPGRVHPRRHPRRADDLRPADQAAVLADLGRLGRGDPGQRGLRRQARPGRPGRRDRRPGDDHRLRQHLRRQRREPHRLRHERPSRPTGLRPVRPRAGGLPGHRVARLLLGQRAAALRGARAVRRGRGARSSSTTATPPTAVAGWSTRRAG